MRKIPFAMLPLLLLCGCAEVTQVPAETIPAVQEAESATTEEAATTPDASDTTQAPAPQPYVYDLCDALTQAEEAQFSAYLEALCSSRMIAAALVVTDDLGGNTPAAYAQSQYDALCGAGNAGFLVLVNNATGKDILHTEGICKAAITNTDVAIAQATPALVEGRYADGAAILLATGEQMPQYVLDRSGVLDVTQAQALEAQAASLGQKHIALLTDTAPEPGAGEDAGKVLASYAEELRAGVKAETFLIMDTKNKRCAIAGKPPALLASEVSSVWHEQDVYAALTHYYDAFAG